MPNVVNSNGITVATLNEIITYLTTAFQSIYGSQVNLDPNSPDGQLLNIFAQSVVDLEDLLVAVFNSMDPDQATGKVLDLRVAINGIQRQAGTYTVTPITVTTNRALTLPGLDQTAVTPYTVADNAGNQWILLSTFVSSAGTNANVLSFRAATPGATLTIPNTITVPVTIVLGVTAINNPSTYTTLGINEESDAALKIRRQQAVALPSQGYYDGLKAALLNTPGVSFAEIVENSISSTNSSGVPAHSIWVIVSGSATDADVAMAIYLKRNAGCGLYSLGGGSSKSFIITQRDGSPFQIIWDTVTAVPLFMKFTLASLDGITPPNIAAIQSYLVSNFIPGVAQQVNVNELATLVQTADPNSLVTSPGFGLTSSPVTSATLTPAAKNNQFVVSGPNIIILPMLISTPASQVTVVSGVVTVTNTCASGGAHLSFSSLGGYGTLTYSMQSGAGSINSSTGLYTSSTIGTDVVKVTDSLSNTAIATITVT